MKKRSKLDLSPDVNQAKTQAAGFDPEVMVDPAPDVKRSRPRASAEVQQPGTVVDTAAVNSSRGLIVASVAVMVVATTLLFLLRKR